MGECHPVKAAATRDVNKFYGIVVSVQRLLKVAKNKCPFKNSLKKIDKNLINLL